jgi:hypothetical protein
VSSPKTSSSSLRVRHRINLPSSDDESWRRTSFSSQMRQTIIHHSVFFKWRYVILPCNCDAVIKQNWNELEIAPKTKEINVL